MTCNILTYGEIDRAEWSRLVRESATGTWFQTPEAYDFFVSMPDLFKPFVVGIKGPTPNPSLKGGEEKPTSSLPSFQGRAGVRLQLRAVCSGYVTVDQNPIKQYFTRRAIIIGGPALADDCTGEEVSELMKAIRNGAQWRNDTTPLVNGELMSPIYIETRNFNDYSRWRSAFVAAGFAYQPHLNFHVDTSSVEAMWERMSENRHRQLRRSDVDIIIIENKNKENTADAEKNSKNIIKHPSSAPACGLHGLECNQLQTPTSELAASVVDYTLDMTLTNEAHPECLSHGYDQSDKNMRDEEYIVVWYEILAELYRTKVKTPLWPVEFFLEAYRQGVGKFMMVRHEGKIIGGSMVVVMSERVNELRNEGCVYEWFECGLNSVYKDQYPSVMATYAGMLYAHEKGCRRYDMMGAGVPGVPYGVRDFKAEFGGEMVEHGRFLNVCKPLLYAIGKIAVKWMKE